MWPLLREEGAGPDGERRLSPARAASGLTRGTAFSRFRARLEAYDVSGAGGPMAAAAQQNHSICDEHDPAGHTQSVAAPLSVAVTKTNIRRHRKRTVRTWSRFA